MGYLISYVDELLVYINTTFKSVSMQLKDVQKAFNSKISILEDCLKSNQLLILLCAFILHNALY